MKISTYIGRKMIFEKISYIGQYSISYIGQYTTILILTDIWLHISTVLSYNLYVMVGKGKSEFLFSGTNSRIKPYYTKHKPKFTKQIMINGLL